MRCTRMTMLAGLLWLPFPNEAAPSDALETTGSATTGLRRARGAGGLVREVERQLPELTKWVNDHHLLELDESKPLIVRETPPHKRGIAGAGIDAPGPYDASAPTYYNVTPLDGERAERAESWLREYNRWMLPVLNIHEAIPGHYVQLVYANRSPSLIKSIFGNGAMIEGGRTPSARCSSPVMASSAPKRGSSTRSGIYAASATRFSTTACTCSA
jgi:hypothetical protein